MPAELTYTDGTADVLEVGIERSVASGGPAHPARSANHGPGSARDDPRGLPGRAATNVLRREHRWRRAPREPARVRDRPD